MRPFIFINLAASADGKISDESKRQMRISCKEDMKRVDILRASSDAIMVGIGTVLSDNPELVVKSDELRRLRMEKGLDANPIRVVVDSRCRVPLNANVLNADAKTIVAVSKAADSQKIKEIRKRVEIVVFGDKKVDLRALVEYLYSIGIKRLMVEGGATLNYGLLKELLVNEIYVYYSSMIIGGAASPTIVDGKSFSPPIKLELIDVEKLGNGVLARWRVIDKKEKTL
jgi:2,5-diamino-6-(ribosylamino)-4(3H)-pyrimidinone 5'-phosphate reductase